MLPHLPREFAHAPVALVDVDVSRPLVGIAVTPRYRAAHVVVKRGEAPIGVLWLPLEAGRCAAPALAAIIHRRLGAALLRRLWRDAAEHPPQGMGRDGLLEILRRRSDRVLPPGGGSGDPVPDLASLSVAVCTRDRPEQLEACLQALRTAGGGTLDVLVVDNAPRSDETRRLLCDFPEFRYVREATPGLDWARNRAIAETRGEILAFLDDDALVSPGWASAVVRAFVLNPEVSAVTGLVLPAELETDAQLLFERNNTGYGRGFERRWARATPSRLGVLARHGDMGALGVGANMAFRRRLFDRVGLFDPALDVGTVTEGGGDLDMLFRVLKYGSMLVYEPDAHVRHLHRRELHELRAQVQGWGSGMAAYLERTALVFPEERWGSRLLRLRKLVTWFASRFAASFLMPRFRRDLVLAELVASFQGAERYRRARTAAAALTSDGSLPAPVRPPSPSPPPRGVSAAGQVELTGPGRPLTGLDEFARVRLGVARCGEILGQVTVEVQHGAVGGQRLRDAVAEALGPRLIGLSARGARRELLSALCEVA